LDSSTRNDKIHLKNKISTSKYANSSPKHNSKLKLSPVKSTLDIRNPVLLEQEMMDLNHSDKEEDNIESVDIATIQSKIGVSKRT
jgi:hypothetical protein